MSDNIRHTSIAEELRSGGSVTVFTIGVSMRPLLTERKTHVTVVPIGAAKNGDIVLYLRKNGSQVLHRCIRQDENHYYMRGDNTYGLERIPRAQAIGVVTHVYRKGKVIDVNTHGGYRCYVAVWTMLYPLRWTVWKFRRIAGRLLH